MIGWVCRWACLQLHTWAQKVQQQLSPVNQRLRAAPPAPHILYSPERKAEGTPPPPLQLPSWRRRAPPKTIWKVCSTAARPPWTRLCSGRTQELQEHRANTRERRRSSGSRSWGWSRRAARARRGQQEADRRRCSGMSEVFSCVCRRHIWSSVEQLYWASRMFTPRVCTCPWSISLHIRHVVVVMLITQVQLYFDPNCWYGVRVLHQLHMNFLSCVNIWTRKVTVLQHIHWIRHLCHVKWDFILDLHLSEKLLDLLSNISLLMKGFRKDNIVLCVFLAVTYLEIMFLVLKHIHLYLFHHLRRPHCEVIVLDNLLLLTVFRDINFGLLKWFHFGFRKPCVNILKIKWCIKSYGTAPWSWFKHLICHEWGSKDLDIRQTGTIPVMLCVAPVSFDLVTFCRLLAKDQSGLMWVWRSKDFRGPRGKVPGGPALSQTKPTQLLKSHTTDTPLCRHVNKSEAVTFKFNLHHHPIPTR